MSLIRTLLREEPNSRFTLLYGNRDSSSVIFLEALAGLKDKHLGRLEIYHFLDAEEQDIELFNGMLDRERLEEAIASAGARCGRGRRLVHLRPRADDGRGRRRAARPQRAQGAHPHRALHRRPPARGGRRAKWRELQTKAEGVTRRRHARRPHAPRAVHRRQHPRQRARVAAFRRRSPARPACARPAGRR